MPSFLTLALIYSIAYLYSLTTLQSYRLPAGINLLFACPNLPLALIYSIALPLLAILERRPLVEVMIILAASLAPLNNLITISDYSGYGCDCLP